MEAGVPSAKKARRLPEVLVPTVPSQSMVGLVKSKQQQQQLPMIQPFQFQPPPPQERKRSMLTPAPPQGAPIYHFYQHQIQQQQQQQQLHRIPSQNLQQPPVPRRIHKRIEEFHDDREPPSNPPWATAPAAMPLPVSLTMPLHALSPTSYAAAIASPPPPPNAGPVRRVGSKRAPAPATEDWRFANGGSMNFMAGPPPPPPPPPGALASAPGGFLVSPASFAGPVSVSVAGGASQRMSSTPSPRLSPVTTTSTANPARAAAIEKRRSKLKQVSAAYHLELESQCQKLLLLQRECRDSDCPAAAAARDVSGIAV